jgi:membrane protein YqaA with SNARE-associated domain
MEYIVAFAAIFVVNLLPAFGPPTWAVLVFFRLGFDLALVPLVLGGAVAAATGRLALAHGARGLRGRVSEERRERLAAAEELVTRDRRTMLGGLALFALSPVPSAQLFVAAGLLAVPLLPLTVAFFAGRLVSYSVYAGGAALVEQSLPDTLTAAFSSPWAVALQIAMLLAIVALLRIDWTRWLRRRDVHGVGGAQPRAGDLQLPEVDADELPERARVEALRVVRR